MTGLTFSFWKFLFCYYVIKTTIIVLIITVKITKIIWRYISEYKWAKCKNSKKITVSKLIEIKSKYTNENELK